MRHVQRNLALSKLGLQKQWTMNFCSFHNRLSPFILPAQILLRQREYVQHAILRQSIHQNPILLLRKSNTVRA
jgi:hypothetical protein